MLSNLIYELRNLSKGNFFINFLYIYKSTLHNTQYASFTSYHDYYLELSFDAYRIKYIHI